MPICNWVALFVAVAVKRENTAFDLVLQSDWELLSLGTQDARSSTPCQKRSQVWDIEKERWPRYLQQRCHCWK